MRIPKAVHVSNSETDVSRHILDHRFRKCIKDKFAVRIRWIGQDMLFLHEFQQCALVEFHDQFPSCVLVVAFGINQLHDVMKAFVRTIT